MLNIPVHLYIIYCSYVSTREYYPEENKELVSLAFPLVSAVSRPWRNSMPQPSLSRRRSVLHRLYPTYILVYNSLTLVTSGSYALLGNQPYF